MEAEDIDRLFLNNPNLNLEEEDYTEKNIKSIKSSVSHIKKLEPNINMIEEETKKIVKNIDTYNVLLKMLSKELYEIETKSVKMETELINRTKIYETLKNLLIKIEVKNEHFEVLESENFVSPESLAKIEKSLEILSDIKLEEYKINVVNEKKEKVRNCLKLFLKRFYTFFEKRMTNMKSESKGELLIHNKIYEMLEKYEFIFLYCRNYDRDNFLLLISCYSYYISKLYEKEFSLHLNFVYQILSENLKKFNEKFKEVFKVFLDSLFLIIKCEFSSIKKLIFGEEDVYEYTNQIFMILNDTIILICNECYSLSSISTISSINKILEEYENKEDEAENKIFKNLLDEIKICTDDMKKDLIKKETARITKDSKRKTVERLIKNLTFSEDEELNEELIRINVEGIEHMDIGSRNKVEFVIYKIKLLYKIKNIEGAKRIEKVQDVYKKLEKDYEKEVLGFVLGDGESKINKKLYKVIGFLKDEDGYYKNLELELIEKMKEIVLDNVNEEYKKNLQTFFGKIKESKK